MHAMALILAAGQGTRMKSKLIKVLHPILGMPMVMWPIQAARNAGLQPCLVVGHQEELVRSALEGEEILFARQPVPRGTGDAVLCAFHVLPQEGAVLVCCGDTPLLRSKTLALLLQAHEGLLATVLTATIHDPASYGRIIRDSKGMVKEIVEASEATPEQLAIQEINTGCYVFDIAWLRSVLPKFQPHQPKNEIYLTDALAYAAKEGRVGAVSLEDFEECQGVNDRWALSQAVEILQERIIQKHALNGVTFDAPNSNHIDADVVIAPEVCIERGVVLKGHTSIGSDSSVGVSSVIIDSDIGENVRILPYCHVEQTVIKDFVQIGPFARLREGTVLEEECRIGNFVETKKTKLARGAKANHLSYLGDASVGEGVNIGAGTITCNYDGFHKHPTVIEKGAFIGSNTALVAPVRVGENAIVGAGSTITKDVLSDSIAISRSVQRNVDGAASRFRARVQSTKEKS